MTQRTNLEKSLIDYVKQHNLTSIDVGYRNWACVAANPFYAQMHFNDAREGEIPCASEDGATLAEALSKTLAVANQKRAPLASAITDELPETQS
jgi:hypothetical protein